MRVARVVTAMALLVVALIVGSLFAEDPSEGPAWAQWVLPLVAAVLCVQALRMIWVTYLEDLVADRAAGMRRARGLAGRPPAPRTAPLPPERLALVDIPLDGDAPAPGGDAA